MSNKAITWAYKQTALKGGRKFVLVTLADLADSEDSCFPGVTLLSEMTGISPSGVREHLTALADLGIVTKEERRRKDGTRTSNRYYLHLDMLLEKQQPESSASQAPESGGSQPLDSGAGDDPDQAPESGDTSARFPPYQAPDSGGAYLNPQVNPQRNPHLQRASARELLDGIPPEPTVDELFDKFWSSWPRKEAKKTARRAYDRALTAARASTSPRVSVAEAAAIIREAVLFWSHQWQQIEHRPLDRIPHPSTWLNGERWNDERPPATGTVHRPRGIEQGLATVEHFRQLEQQPVAPQIGAGR